MICSSTRLWCEIFHRGDRAMIYVFIAGAYTPWLNLKEFQEGAFAHELKWAIWYMAMAGLVYQQLFHERYKLIDTLVYVLIALTPSLAVLEMVKVVPQSRKGSEFACTSPSSRK